MKNKINIIALKEKKKIKLTNNDNTTPIKIYDKRKIHKQYYDVIITDNNFLNLFHFNVSMSSD